MKIGDVVEVHDGSYSFELKDGKLESTGDINHATYEVIAIDCVLPSDDHAVFAPKSKNNTIIVDLYSKSVIFTQARFLHLKHRCHICPKCKQSI